MVVSGLCAGYGTMEVVSGVTLEVAPGEAVSLIGRNGAGKTTTLLAIGGVRYGRSGGSVTIGELDLSRASPAAIVEAGIALVPEGHRIFRRLTVTENLMIGRHVRRKAGRAATDASMAQVFDLFPILKTYATRSAGYLSGGEQQMVAIGQALMGDPKILLLDEPTSGLSVMVIRTIIEVLAKLRDAGVGLLVVDQSVQRALDNSSRTYVLERGRIVMAGPSKELALDERVFAIVRGTEDVAEAAGSGP